MKDNLDKDLLKVILAALDRARELGEPEQEEDDSYTHMFTFTRTFDPMLRAAEPTATKQLEAEQNYEQGFEDGKKHLQRKQYTDIEEN